VVLLASMPGNQKQEENSQREKEMLMSELLVTTMQEDRVLGRWQAAKPSAESQGR
jgi:hypothetical protein